MSINKTNLNKSITNRGGFSMMPNDIWDQPISNHAKIVYMYLLAQSEKWNPGSREIAEGTSIGRDSVRKALKELEENGMINISEGPRGLRDIYEFCPIEDWKGGPNQVQCPTKVSPGVDLPKSSGGPNQVHIQEESKTNPTIYLTRQMDGKRGKVNSFEEQECLAWRAHYLKSSYYETLFDSLSLKDKLSVQQIQDKEECLTFLNTFRQTTCEDMSVEL